ncbi:MAG: hypothetical protein LAT81_05115 [Oceanicaulis sp.]|nr:hypothetical protein [Oceanicaulis sp.]
MKNLIQKQYSSLLLIATLAFVVTACSTTGMQRSEKVQSSLQTVDNDISSIVVQLDAINSSLDELTKPGQADRKQAFDLFSENVSKIKEMEGDFAKHSKEMEKAGDAYFASWNKDSQQYDNPEIQREFLWRQIAVIISQPAEATLHVT